MSREAQPIDAAVLGQIGRDLVLRVDELPGPGGAAPARERLELLGGKGANQAVGLVQLGLKVCLFGVIGDDRAGREVIEQAAADGIDVTSAIRRPGVCTALLLDVVEPGGQRRLIEDVPDETLLTPQDVAHLLPAVLTAATVVLQMQQPGESMAIAARGARAAGRRVLLDGAPQPAYREELLALSQVVRADRKEAATLLGRDLDGADETLDAAAELVREHDLDLVALEAGSAGNAVAWAGGRLLLPLPDEPVVDPTGAGDAWVAGLTAGLHRGLAHRSTAELGAAAASLTVQRPGGRPDLTPLG
jgi:ribokinase